MAERERMSSPMLVSAQPEDLTFYLQRVPPGPVLVLGGSWLPLCWALCAQGADVVAVESSEALVAEAEAQRRSEGAELAQRLTVRCADPRTVRLGERFHRVLAPQNAAARLGGLEGLAALFHTAREHLDAEGAFLFDVGNREPLAPRPPRPTDPHPPVSASFERSGKRPAHLRERNGGAQALVRLGLSRFSPDAVDQALIHVGLRAHERYGGFDAKPFDPADPVQCVLARPG